MTVDTIIILLLSLALIMLLVELFMPDFGICGGIGILALIAAAVTAIRFTDHGLAVTILCLSLAGVTVFAVYKTLTSKRAQGTIILDVVDESSLGAVAIQPGTVGVTLTSLRPIGTVSFRGYKTDAICEHGTLEAGTQVMLTRISGGKVYVELYKEEGAN